MNKKQHTPICSAYLLEEEKDARTAIELVVNVIYKNRRLIRREEK
jgi:hypothetical protein